MHLALSEMLFCSAAFPEEKLRTPCIRAMFCWNCFYAFRVRIPRSFVFANLTDLLYSLTLKRDPTLNPLSPFASQPRTGKLSYLFNNTVQLSPKEKVQSGTFWKTKPLENNLTKTKRKKKKTAPLEQNKIRLLKAT